MGKGVLTARVRRLASVIGSLTFLVASAVLLGWALGLSALTTITHGSTPMAAITAVCFVLAGLAVWASGSVDPHRHGRRLNLGVRQFKNASAGVIVLVG